MTAKEVAEILMQHPDAEVRVWVGDGYRLPVEIVTWHSNYPDQILMQATPLARHRVCRSGCCCVQR